MLYVITAIIAACVTLVVYALIINGSVTTREQVLEDRAFRYRRALLKIMDEARNVDDARSVVKFALQAEPDGLRRYMKFEPSNIASVTKEEHADLHAPISPPDSHYAERGYICPCNKCVSERKNFLKDMASQI